MARISGVDLPREKRVEIGLTYIYGIGRTSSIRILKEADVDPDIRVKDLTDEQAAYLVQSVTEVVAHLRWFSPIWRDLVSGKKEFIL